MFHMEDVSGMSPMIIETISIEVDDFSDSFLTCGSCMQTYDASSRTPKLLPCSHTVCRSCAARIVEEAAARDGAQTCCPTCSRVFIVPAGGVVALPASFVVNQLLDLIANGRRRDVVPKCAEHVTAELLFCETCDSVFCSVCDAGGSEVHGSAGSTASAAHTVVPFAVAIRRVSEILQYKSTQCMRNLDAAVEAIELEMRHLDVFTERCVDSVDQIFGELSQAVEQRKQEVVTMIRHTSFDKKQVLLKQLDIVEAERECVDRECHGLPTDVRGITSRIGNLNERMDSLVGLSEPRENAFIVFNDSGMRDLCDAIEQCGSVRVSETFPALCRIVPPDTLPTIHLKAKAVMIAYDINGLRRTSGGDPVSAELMTELGERVCLLLCDNGDGTYDVNFTPTCGGQHQLIVKVFDRVINRGVPFIFSVKEFQEPLATYSSDLRQPVAVCVDGDGHLFVLDTGNSRISVFDARAATCDVLRYVVSDAMEQRGATGLWMLEADAKFVIANWRLCCIAEISFAGVVTQSFVSDRFKEPTSVAVDHNGTRYVADNAAGTIFCLTSAGVAVKTIGTRGEKPGCLGLMTSVYASPIADEILVCDHRVQAFSCDGKYLYTLPPGDGHGKGQYGGVAIDTEGRYLASRSEKGRAFIQVFDSMRRWQFSIDSGPSARMRRPSGLAVDRSGHVYVADLGNSCIRKFLYI